MKTHQNRTRGISLLEALIALAVLAFGLLGIAKLHSDLVHSTAVAKARAEAVQLAESKIEGMRNVVLSGQHADLVAEGPLTHPGVNATFEWATSIDKSQDPFLVSALVTWADARSLTQEVQIQSELGWSSRVLSARMSTDDGASTLDKIQPPTGLARFGQGEEALEETDTNDLEPDSMVPVTRIVGDDRLDNTRILWRDDGYSQLVSEAGTVLLTMQATTRNRTFGIISGRVYFDTAAISFGTQQNNVFVRDVRIVPSDTVLCTRVFGNKVDLGTGNRAALLDLEITQEDLFVDNDKSYFEYFCYVGERWYGNVGVVRLDSAPLNHRVCVGDPAVQPPVAPNAFSRHPQLQTVRKYRGNRFRDDDPDQGVESIGLIGEITNTGFGEDGRVTVAGPLTPAQLASNHFLVTRITGAASDADCGTPLGRAVHSAELSSNPGEFVCLPGEFCIVQPGEDPPFSILSGAITYDMATAGTPIGPWALEVDGAEFSNSCHDDDLWLDDQTWRGRYECSIPRPGWTGVGTWIGKLIAPAGYRFSVPDDGELGAQPIDSEISVDIEIEQIVGTVP